MEIALRTGKPSTENGISDAEFGDPYLNSERGRDFGD